MRALIFAVGIGDFIWAWIDRAQIPLSLAEAVTGGAMLAWAATPELWKKRK
jgi:hypothetical protein